MNPGLPHERWQSYYYTIPATSHVAQGQECQGLQSLLSSPEALEEKGVSGQGGSPRSNPCPLRGCRDRCLPVRLGCHLAAQDHLGQMERTAQVGTYKWARAQGKISCTTTFSTSIAGAACSCPHRQHLSSVSHKSSGWHQVQAGAAGVKAAPYVGVSPLPEPQGHTPRVQNRVADVLSRQGLPQGDWRLHPEVV